MKSKTKKNEQIEALVKRVEELEKKLGEKKDFPSALGAFRVAPTPIGANLFKPSEPVKCDCCGKLKGKCRRHDGCDCDWSHPSPQPFRPQPRPIPWRHPDISPYPIPCRKRIPPGIYYGASGTKKRGVSR